MLCGRNMNQGREAERALTAAAHYHHHYCYRGLLGEIPPSRENVPVYHTVLWIRSRTQRCKAITYRHTHARTHSNEWKCTILHTQACFYTLSPKFLCLRSYADARTHADSLPLPHTSCALSHTNNHSFLWADTVVPPPTSFLCPPKGLCPSHTHMFLQSRLTHGCFTSFRPIRESSTSPLNPKLFSFTWSFFHHYIKDKHSLVINLSSHICSFIEYLLRIFISLRSVNHCLFQKKIIWR